MMDLLNREDYEIALRFKKRLLDNGVPAIELRVYGSRARGNFSSESDLDIFFLLGSVPPEIKRIIDEADRTLHQAEMSNLLRDGFNQVRHRTMRSLGPPAPRLLCKYWTMPDYSLMQSRMLF